MRSWGGTSRVTVLKPTLTILSTIGIRMKRPGPLARPCTLPSLKITPRSYSLTILMALIRINKITATTATTTMAVNPIPTDCNKPNKLVFMRDTPFASILGVEDGAMAGPLNGHYLHHSSIAETHHNHFSSFLYNRRLTSRVSPLGGERQHSPPALAMHEHPPLRFQP